MKKPPRVTKIAIITAAALASASLTAAPLITQVSPSKTTRPYVLEHEVGKTVTVQVTIDAQGIPQKVVPVDVGLYEESLSERVAMSVYNWEFSPAKDGEGNSVAVTVQLPVYIKSLQRS